MADSGDLWWCEECGDLVKNPHLATDAAGNWHHTVMVNPALYAAIEARAIERCADALRDCRLLDTIGGLNAIQRAFNEGIERGVQEIRSLIPQKEAPT